MPHLVSDRLVLRPYELSDLEAIHQWKNDPETTRWMGPRFREPTSREAASESLQRALATDPKVAHYFAIAERATLRYLGGIDLTGLDPQQGSAVLSLVIARAENRGRGYGREAIRLLLDYAFHEVGLRRVTLRVAEANEPAVRCYLACGFRFDGESEGLLTMAIETLPRMTRERGPASGQRGSH